jgi:hypothetical protein
MRMSWLILTVLLLAVLGGMGFAAWYSLAVPGRPHEGPLPSLTAEEQRVAGALEQHVTAIASVPHNVDHYDALERSAQYIEETLRSFGYVTTPQVFSSAGRAVRNIEATRDPARAGGDTSTLVLGAHYDSFGDAPGANDNGTGTALVLELAHLLRDWQPKKARVRYVLFVNEEPPHYRTEDMGSLHYARLLAERRERVQGMISFETLGAFSDLEGTQHYPPPFGLIFPTTANFVALVALPASRSFLHTVMSSFRRHAAFPTIGGVAPDLVPGIGWSDHWAFVRHGFPAMMVTDTALFRYAHYHLPSDTPDKIDYGRLARITKGFERVVRELAP